jgi:hypothetical protein
VTGGLIVIALFIGGVIFGADLRYLATDEKNQILFIVAQNTAAVQGGVNANQLQLMQWELNDINARIATKNERKEDRSRKVILEARMAELAKK